MLFRFLWVSLYNVPLWSSEWRGMLPELTFISNTPYTALFLIFGPESIHQLAILYVSFKMNVMSLDKKRAAMYLEETLCSLLIGFTYSYKFKDVLKNDLSDWIWKWRHFRKKNPAFRWFPANFSSILEYIFVSWNIEVHRIIVCIKSRNVVSVHIIHLCLIRIDFTRREENKKESKSDAKYVNTIISPESAAGSGMMHYEGHVGQAKV